MEKRIWGPRFWVVLVCAAVVVVLALGVHRARKRLASAPVWKERPVPMETAPVRHEKLADTLRYLARLEPAAQAALSPRLTANVVAVLVDEGDAVAQGDLLVVLDDRDLRAELETLKAKVQALQAKLVAVTASEAAARKDVEYYRQEFDRDQALFEKKGISASALDTSRNRLTSALGRWESLAAEGLSARREVDAAKAQLKEAETRLSYTRIEAPFRGMVTRRLVDPGDLAKPGVPVLEMMDCSAAKLAVDAVQEDLTALRPGQTLRVHWPEEYAELPKGIAITRIFPAMEAFKSVRVEAEFPWTCGAPLRPGSFVPAEVVIREGEGLSVSRRALVPGTGGVFFVYAVRDNRLAKVPVEVVILTEDRALVRGEIRPGEQAAVGEYLQWVRRHEGLLVKTEGRS